MPTAPLLSPRHWPFPSGSAPRFSGPATDLGVPFLTDEFGPLARLAVEAAFAADITSGEPQLWNWVDVTADVRYADGGRVSISPMGRADESSSAQPAGCAFQLDNTSGDYTAYSTASKWSPYVRRSTPIRVRMTLDGTTWFIRFQGYATGWKPGWDESAAVATVDVAAQGVTRRLQQGSSPLKSALTRALLAAGPTAYWPLDDESGAAQIASGLPGGVPMTFSDGIELGAYTDLGGAVRAANLGNGSMVATLANTAVPAAADRSWVLSFSMKYTEPLNASVPEASYPLIRFNMSGDINYVEVRPITKDVDAFFYVAAAYSNGTGTTFGISYQSGTSTDISDGWHNYQIVLDFKTATNTLRIGASVDGLFDPGIAFVPAVTRVSGIKTVEVNREQFDWGVFGISGLAVYDGTTALTDSGAAYNGYDGESPTERIARLCTEELIPVEIFGTSETAMGPQRPGTFITLVRECEAAEQGVLYDGRGPGLSFVTRSMRYNLTAGLTVDAGAGELDFPFVPVDDDQRNVNAAKAERASGSSAVYDDELSELGWRKIGIYDTSVTVNVQSDLSLLDYAGWLVRLGTQSGFRYPSLGLDFRATPTLGTAWLASSVSSRIDVTNASDLATQHPVGTISLLLEGWSEELSPLDWTAHANTSQYGPWDVGTLDDAPDLDCGASVLAADMTASSTSVSLAISDTCVWTHADGDFVITIDQEDMTVTAAAAASGSGSAWTQTLTVTRGANSTPIQVHSTGAKAHMSNASVFVLSL